MTKKLRFFDTALGYFYYQQTDSKRVVTFGSRKSFLCQVDYIVSMFLNSIDHSFGRGVFQQEFLQTIS